MSMINSTAPHPSKRWARAQSAWAALATRERTMIGSTVVLVAFALLWWLAISPALDTLRNAGTRQQAADAELQSMRSLAAEATSLQALPRLRPDDSRRALEQSIIQQLDSSAQLTVMGERAVVTLKNTPPASLSRWLALARSNARAVPTDAHLTMNAARTGWDGSLTLALPPP